MQTFVIEFMPSFVILIQYVSICKSDLTSYLGKKLYVFFRVALFYVIFFQILKFVLYIDGGSFLLYILKQSYIKMLFF
jgi:hypothetical protein